MSHPSKPPRRTQWIPRSQRKRRSRSITLGTEAEAVLAAQGNASAYLEHLILADERRKKLRGTAKGT